MWHLDPQSSRFPRELDEIESAPTDIWGEGTVELFDVRPRVAIVGSRSPSPYGFAQAHRFARQLAAAGVAIVSGLARGIDHTAHEAALDVGGVTLALLGSGVDRPWPRGPLAERIRSEGLLLSEFAPGTPPRRHHFPLRNRLISALAEVVVVIEAAYASGSLITARWAVDQGRDVYAVPGRVDHPMARGCHRLIREGATLIEDPDVILSELGLRADRVDTDRADDERRAPHSPLLALLEGETLSLDDFCARLDRSASLVLSELVQLELAGRIVRAPGGLYRLP